MSDSSHPTPFQAPEVEEVARLFPAYEVLGLIACGGMGAVYHAIQTSLERPVAIKMLPREFSTDAEFRAGFEAEAKAMAKLNDPNLIGVYDFGEVGGMLYIVMEFVAGKSLHQMAHGCAVEPADAINLVIGVCRGLAHAHEFGILHRDIKPSNILLDGQNNPKIGDFGLARALEREIQEGEQIFGTPGYTAPEVLQPPFQIDQRADIFSVGVMLHELLTGKLPDADPRPASQIVGCNHRLDAVIQRATHPDPARRYNSAQELADELAKIAAMPNRTLRTGPPAGRARSPVAPAKPAPAKPAASGHSVFAPPPSRSAFARPPGAHSARPGNAAVTRPPAPKESSGAGIAIALVVLLVIAVVAFFVTRGKHGKEPEKTAAPAPQASAPPPPAPVPAPADPEETKADPADVLRRVRASIRQRVDAVDGNLRRDLQSNISDYKAALIEGAEGLAAADRERVMGSISDHVAAWAANGNRIAETSPEAFRSIANAQELHAEHLRKQASIERESETGMSNLARIYELELHNEIGKLEKSGDDAAASALEEEIRAIGADANRFRAIFAR